MKSLPKKAGKKPDSKSADMPLGTINYVMIAGGAALIALSYLGMYLERDADGFFSLYISPLTLVAAYVWIIFAVLLRRKKEAS